MGLTIRREESNYQGGNKKDRKDKEKRKILVAAFGNSLKDY